MMVTLGYAKAADSAKSQTREMPANAILVAQVYPQQQGNSVEFGETPPPRRVYAGNAVIRDFQHLGYVDFYLSPDLWCKFLDAYAVDYAHAINKEDFSPDKTRARFDGLRTISAGVHVQLLSKSADYTCSSAITHQTLTKRFIKLRVVDTSSNLNGRTGFVDDGAAST
jgi:hypothetical protein